ncbi:MAG: hypothetical protein WDO70_01325 [Alphaproteobacteria bacterium]
MSLYITHIGTALEHRRRDISDYRQPVRPIDYARGFSPEHVDGEDDIADLKLNRRSRTPAVIPAPR